MNLKDRIKAEVAALDVRARPWAARSPWHARAYEFLLFGLKQAWACLFGALMLALLVGTFLFWPRDAALARYDFLVVASLSIQIALLALKLERWDEALVILVFHVVGTVMEVFKTAHGSWIYPEPSLLRVERRALVHGLHVRLCRQLHRPGIRLFDITFIRYPPFWSTWILAGLAYVNFFSHHYGRISASACSPSRPDLLAELVPVHARREAAPHAGDPRPGAGRAVHLDRREHRHPDGGLGLSQPADGWRLVSINKLGAWYLLMLLSWVLVSLVHRPEGPEAPRNRPMAEGGGSAESTSGSTVRSRNRCCSWRSVLKAPVNWVVMVDTSPVVHAAGGHALVHGVDQHGDAGRAQAVLHGVGHLLGHGLLGLQTLGEDLDQAASFERPTTRPVGM
jgi:uncharacterized membrane protein YoaT (DUF817 family)